MISSWVIALAITLAIEVPVVGALFPGQRRRMAVVAALTNALTNPAMNLWLLPLGAGLFAGEAAALLVEAAVYALAGRPRELGRALVASSLANALSFAAGLLLFR